MEEKAGNKNRTVQEEQYIFAESEENRLRAAVVRVTPDENARRRIIEGVKAGKHGRRRLAARIPAAVLAAGMLLCLLWLGGGQSMLGEEVVVYAATEEHGWQRLEEGERILLKKEPFETPGEDEAKDAPGEKGYTSYYPYKCTFLLTLPEHYLYDKSFTTIRDDFIGERGGRIEWLVAPDRPEDAGRVMQGELTLWIVDENRERLAALELELTKEDGNCYAELKRGWESEAYQEKKHKK